MVTLSVSISATILMPSPVIILNVSTTLSAAILDINAPLVTDIYEKAF